MAFTLYPETILMPVISTTVQAVTQAVSDDFTNSQQSTNASNVYHVQGHVLKEYTLCKLGGPKACMCRLPGELIIDLT